ncbi:MAG TPA: hypothetical protein VEW94_04395 [Chloroflexia bacterium]|nr:hypothetical protein [Chloroflexia bacterium]
MHPIQQKKRVSEGARPARRVPDREAARLVARVRVAPVGPAVAHVQVVRVARHGPVAGSATRGVAPEAASEVAEIMVVAAARVEAIAGRARQARACAVALAVVGSVA